MLLSMASSVCSNQETIGDPSAQASRPLQRLSQENVLPKCQTWVTGMRIVHCSMEN